MSKKTTMVALPEEVIINRDLHHQETTSGLRVQRSALKSLLKRKDSVRIRSKCSQIK